MTMIESKVRTGCGKWLPMAAVLVTAFGASAASGDYYQWNGVQNDWRYWGDAANWHITNETTHVSSPATTAPGANDSVEVGNGTGDERNPFPQYIWADLGGKDWMLRSLDFDKTWRNGNANLHLTNGTLTVTSVYEFYGNNTENSIWNGAIFTIAPTVAHCYEGKVNSSNPPWYIRNGGAMNMLAEQLDMFNAYHEVKAGGFLRLEPKKIIWQSSGAWPNRYVNYGTFVVTNGFDMTGSKEPDNAKTTMSKTHSLRRDGWASYISFDHLGGTFKMGGKFSNGGLKDGAYYVTWQRYCTVEVVKDLTFVGFDCAVSNNATVALSVASGATADLSTFHFGANTTINKTGAGTLLMGEAMPTALNVQNGGYMLTVADPSFADVTLANGVTVILGYNGTMRIDELTNYENLDFVLDTSRVTSGTTFFTSSSDGLLSRVKTQVESHLPATLEVVKDSNLLCLLEKKENVIDVSTDVSLSDYSAYAGQPIVLRGHGIATLDATSPKFASVTLEVGSTLKVSGGTEASPIELPPVTVAYDSRLLIADGSYALVTNGWSFAANDESIGIFEIETNAIAFVQDVAYPNKSIIFKNVDFRLYGQLRTPYAKADSSYVGSQMYFGYAENGETGHVAFKADGGSIYAPHPSSACYVGNRALVAIASPAVGGRVKVHGEVLFRDFRKIYNLATPDNPQVTAANSGYFFGVNNPVDETFEVVVDNTLLAPGGPTKFAGGSHTRFVNGAQLARPELTNNQTIGHTRGVFICDAAKVDFDGGWICLDRCCGSKDLGRGFNFSSTVAGHTSLSLNGGAKVTLWETYGNATSVCEVTDAIYTVPLMPPPRMNYTKDLGWYVFSGYSQTNTPAFNGFASVNVLPGGRLVFDASDDYWLQGCNTISGNPNPLFDRWYYDWWEWDRKTAMERPIVGEGEVVVTNTLAGPDRRNTEGKVKDVTFPDLSTWNMDLVVRCPSNTCTGVIRAATNVNAYLQFADGANWAGTVIGNSHTRLGDSIAELATSQKPATATFGSICFEDNFPIRVWKNGKNSKTNDFVNILGETTSVKGGLYCVDTSGAEPAPGEFFLVGRCPKSTPPHAARKWKVNLVDDPDDETKSLVYLSYSPDGLMFFIK